MTDRIRIGTRRSALALWQANHVAALLRVQEPSLDVVLVEMSTVGDQILDKPLATVGGKGLFVKEIEDALLRREIDLAVHSLKDLPAQLPQGLELGAVPEREDVRDALCAPAHKSLGALPTGARVGTSSLRRACQLKALRPDLEIVSIRGNVETRLKKLQTERLDAVVLAYAGLKRLGLAGRATELISTEVMLPAVGQGALGLEMRSGDALVGPRLARLDHPDTRAAVAAERAFLGTLEGNCQVPIAAHATLVGSALHIRGLVGTPDGREVLRDDRTGDRAHAVTLGAVLGDALLSRGARAILRGEAAEPARAAMR